MPRFVTLTVCSLLLAGIATAASGCGEDRSNLLPGDTVAEISANLDLVNQIYQEGDCLGAISTADQIKTQVLELGPSVDPKLKKNLDDGVNELIVNIRSACTEDSTGTTTDTTTLEPAVTPDSSTGTTGTTTDAPASSVNDQTTGNDNATKPDTKPAPDPAPEPTNPPPTEPVPETPPVTPPDSGGVGPGT